MDLRKAACMLMSTVWTLSGLMYLFAPKFAGDFYLTNKNWVHTPELDVALRICGGALLSGAAMWCTVDVEKQSKAAGLGLLIVAAVNGYISISGNIVHFGLNMFHAVITVGVALILLTIQNEPKTKGSRRS